MQHLEVSCAVRRFFKSLGFKGLSDMVDKAAVGQVYEYILITNFCALIIIYS